MEPATLAAAAVALLSPYLVEGAKEFAQKVGGAAFAGVETLCGLVREKLAGPVAALEAAPADEDERALLRIQLKKALAADPDFAARLRALVDDVREKGGAAVTQMLTISGDHSKGAQITGSGNIVNQ
jgi:hypothetical protein